MAQITVSSEQISELAETHPEIERHLRRVIPEAFAPKDVIIASISIVDDAVVNQDGLELLRVAGSGRAFVLSPALQWNIRRQETDRGVRFLLIPTEPGE